VSGFPKTSLNQLHRYPNRGAYDKETIYSIVDEALICHVGFVVDGQPYVIPTIHARLGDKIILHGAVANRMLTHITEGNPLCVTVTLVDGLVLARSVFHSSMNYRSAVLFGKGRLLESNEEKLRALEALTEHIARGRWNDARKPNRKELDGTTVIAMTIESASAKVRTGPPSDDEEDYALPIWAGVVPMELRALEAENDPKLQSSIPTPTYVHAYSRPQHQKGNHE
jgi:nitroimidazol reductase NimA-like FMN-containing flavoprotein (pyridoxamine 5'-phosphate oxidase superfamily)